MNGFAKIPRRVATEGYFAMPELAFKIWVYCLVKATPFPTETLNVGELQLTYNEIQANLRNDGKTVSRNRVSASLDFLKQHKFLQISITPGSGMKVSIAAVLPQYQNNTASSIAAVLPNWPQVGNNKPSEAHKNNVKNIKDIVNNINLKKEFPRYTNNQYAIIKDYWCAVINTANPQSATQLVLDYMQQWEQFDRELVLAALNIHLKRHSGKGAGYTVGIMKRLQQDQAKGGDQHGGNQHGGFQGQATTAIDALVAEKQRRTSHLDHLLSG